MAGPPEIPLQPLLSRRACDHESDDGEKGDEVGELPDRVRRPGRADQAGHHAARRIHHGRGLPHGGGAGDGLPAPVQHRFRGRAGVGGGERAEHVVGAGDGRAHEADADAAAARRASLAADGAGAGTGSVRSRARAPRPVREPGDAAAGGDQSGHVHPRLHAAQATDPPRHAHRRAPGLAPDAGRVDGGRAPDHAHRAGAHGGRLLLAECHTSTRWPGFIATTTPGEACAC